MFTFPSLINIFDTFFFIFVKSQLLFTCRGTKFGFYEAWNVTTASENTGRKYRKSMNVQYNPKYINNQQMHFNIYDIFYSQCSHQHVSAGIPAIFSVILILQESKRTNMVNCVTIIPMTVQIKFRLKLCK